MDNTYKEQVAQYSHEFVAVQRVKTTKKDTEASRQPQRTNDATNMASKSTTSTRIKFDIIGKSGVKLPSLALVDLGEEKSFMSYGTWVLSGQPTLDKSHKIIQEWGKSTVECMGMVSSTIYINSQPLEGEFYVIAPRNLQTDLVLGRQLAKVALDLLKSQAMPEQGLNYKNAEGHMCVSSPTGAPSVTCQEQAQPTQQKLVLELPKVDSKRRKRHIC